MPSVVWRLEMTMTAAQMATASNAWPRTASSMRNRMLMWRTPYPCLHDRGQGDVP